MSLVRVRWQVTEDHEADFEIHGYDPDAGIDDCVLADEEGGATQQATGDREVVEITVLREGDEPIEIPVTAPQYEPEF